MKTIINIILTSTYFTSGEESINMGALSDVQLSELISIIAFGSILDFSSKSNVYEINTGKRKHKISQFVQE